MTIKSQFKANIINIYGEIGRTWLIDLPKIISKVANENDLSDLKPLDNLTYNYVLAGLRGKQPIILKLSPDIKKLNHESSSLKAFANFGAVKIFSRQNGVLILERAISGISLKSYFPTKESEAIEITCNVIKKLHQAPIPKKKVPHVKDWLAALDREQNIPSVYLKKARKLKDELLQTSIKQVLLHGDLHHDNIVQNDNGWLIIDPKGVIGEQAYEVCAFIRNPLQELSSSKHIVNIINNRITHFTNILNLDFMRIKDWCFVQSVLAWIWALENNCNTKYFKRLTEIFHDL
jgi:streptomycin 6-kinase